MAPLTGMTAFELGKPSRPRFVARPTPAQTKRTKPASSPLGQRLVLKATLDETSTSNGDTLPLQNTTIFKVLSPTPRKLNSNWVFAVCPPSIWNRSLCEGGACPLFALGSLRMDFPIAIIGAGFAGIGAAVQLKKAGIESFTIFERSSEVGGTWRDNTYPGAACDVPSHVYSLSFEQNPNWSRRYATSSEIQEYLVGVVDKIIKLALLLRHSTKYPKFISMFVIMFRFSLLVALLSALALDTSAFVQQHKHGRC